MNRRVTRLTAISMCLMLAAPVALAQRDDASANLPAWLATFNGQVRVYEFDRFHNNNLDNPSVRSAFATAAKLFAQTKSLYGFSTGLGLYAASNFGLSPLPASRDGSLMGNGDSFATPAEAFLQYNYGIFQARLGNQLLKTPWVWGSDSRVIPAAYQGLTASLQPLKNLNIEAAYIQRWKNRTSPDFSTTNLYGVDPSDFWYAGAVYGMNVGASDLKFQGWMYSFTDIANMAYLQADYRYRTGGVIDPVAAVQFAHESDTGKALLGKVNAQVWGAEAGVAAGPGTYTVAYDVVPSSTGAFENGNIVTPYTHSYATDPLFTTSMTQGLADQTTSGHAWKIKGVYFFGGNRAWRFIASYARYSQAQFNHPNQTGNPSEVDMDATYFFKTGPLKGFSIRDRLGVFSYSGQQATFVYNRLQFQYDF
ncbi:MAG: OprD family outer membrane porin [Gammaproteobacteria bacterium]